MDRDRIGTEGMFPKNVGYRRRAGLPAGTLVEAAGHSHSGSCFQSPEQMEVPELVSWGTPLESGGERDCLMTFWRKLFSLDMDGCKP